MTTIIIVFAALYIVLGAGIVFRLIDIRNHPEKYEEAELQGVAEEMEDRKSHFRFFRSLSHQYAMVNLVIVFLLSVVAYGIIVACSVLIAEEDSIILLDTQFAGVVAAFFLNTIVGMAVIPLFIKIKFFAVSLLDVFHVVGRREIWKRTYVVFLVLFLGAFPFFALGCNNYTHYNDSGITVSRYFQVDETYTAYEEIQEVAIYISHNNSGKVAAIHYELRLSDGGIFNINDGIGAGKHVTGTTIEIHKLLEKNANCAPKITPLNNADYDYLKGQSEEQAAAILYIFEGFHR